MRSPGRSPVKALDISDAGLPSPRGSEGGGGDRRPAPYDDDVSGLAVRLDDFSCFAKSGLVDYVVGMKQRLAQERDEAVDLERRIAAARLAAKQEELDTARLTLAETQARLGAVKTHLFRAAGQIFASNTRAEGMKVLGVALYTWRKFVHDARRRRMLEERAARFHKKTLLMAWHLVRRPPAARRAPTASAPARALQPPWPLAASPSARPRWHAPQPPQTPQP